MSTGTAQQQAITEELAKRAGGLQVRHDLDGVHVPGLAPLTVDEARALARALTVHAASLEFVYWLEDGTRRSGA